VDVPNGPALEGSTITVSAWVKADRSPGHYKYIVTKGGNRGDTGSYALYTGARGGLEFYVATSPTTYVASPDAGTTVWDGRWHSVVGTFDGSMVRLYVDGRQVGAGSRDTSAIQFHLASGNDLVIGDYPWSSGLAFEGDIDELKVFNRALSPSEIGLGYRASGAMTDLAAFDGLV
jgi:hypothetical protein